MIQVDGGREIEKSLRQSQMRMKEVAKRNKRQPNTERLNEQRQGIVLHADYARATMRKEAALLRNKRNKKARK